jgi:hypothetical protein
VVRGGRSRAGELRRVDALITAAAPGIDRQLVPMGTGAMLGYRLLTAVVRDAVAVTDAGNNAYVAV